MTKYKGRSDNFYPMSNCNGVFNICDIDYY